MSGQVSGQDVDVQAVQDDAVDSGVAHGDVLLAFTDAVMARDADAIVKTRDVVREKLGDEGVVDASAIILAFNIVDRIADSTGIPIDEGFAKDLRYQVGSELGMDHLKPEERAAR